MPNCILTLGKLFKRREKTEKIRKQNVQKGSNSIHTHVQIVQNTPGPSQVRKSSSCRDFFRKLSTRSSRASNSDSPRAPPVIAFEDRILHGGSDIFHTPPSEINNHHNFLADAFLTEDEYGVSLATIPLSPYAISFDDNVLSTSTSKEEDTHPFTTTSSSASVTEANVQIYQPAHVKIVEMPEYEEHHSDNDSLFIEEELNEEDPISQTIISKSGTLEETTTNDRSSIYRLEMVNLVAKHQSIMAKQEREIAHLKKLLLEQRHVNNLLSMATHKGHTSQAAKDPSEFKVRSSFIPIQIISEQNAEEEQPKDLLPPFIAKRQDQVSVRTEMYRKSSSESSWARHGSITSDVSSIMSSSHRHQAQRKLSEDSYKPSPCVAL
ncbi:uncharacterized protein SPAPADRAFT_48644 [Spathaspora passalidarum NRRL Y-27907]|uniref:Uncharacterized protein n=1 Tax=Spathaspora passalidarum (strain NRRL Y-27907 / 11-Y1) TaxID=619300 RepID=G3AEP9_SPAPN|nr:uncharacterized protein SPAPADRAFT_48644 [Spathaspora passalidarum NRRL Y-27907]EGW35676.1 hypothetical protein SPAPADRAFT_48644 [Spathaspora passalidarum NRRL Y-27907]